MRRQASTNLRTRFSREALFQSLDRVGDRPTGRPLTRRVVLAMIKQRAAAVGRPPSTCCHTFRATGITAYLSNGGTLEHAQQIAWHASPKMTKLYDRPDATVTVDKAHHDLNRRGEGHERLHGAAREDAGERLEVRRRRRRRRFCCLRAREHPGDEAQVVERPAIGGRGLPPAPVPIDVLVQRERVRYFGDQVVAFAVIHPACLGFPRSAPTCRSAAASSAIRLWCAARSARHASASSGTRRGSRQRDTGSNTLR